MILRSFVSFLCFMWLRTLRVMSEAYSLCVVAWEHGTEIEHDLTFTTKLRIERFAAYTELLDGVVRGCCIWPAQTRVSCTQIAREYLGEPPK